MKCGSNETASLTCQFEETNDLDQLTMISFERNEQYPRVKQRVKLGENATLI